MPDAAEAPDPAVAGSEAAPEGDDRDDDRDEWVQTAPADLDPLEGATTRPSPIEGLSVGEVDLPPLYRRFFFGKQRR